jgi:hypothetical protein
VARTVILICGIHSLRLDRGRVCVYD